MVKNGVNGRCPIETPDVTVLTTGHAGEAARVIEAVLSLAGVVRPVHAFPTLHAGSCRHNGVGGGHNGHTHTRLDQRAMARRLPALWFTAHSEGTHLKPNATRSVNTCKSSRSHHLGDFHTVETPGSPRRPECSSTPEPPLKLCY